jgi:hypothetical protein
MIIKHHSAKLLIQMTNGAVDGDQQF